MMISCLNPRPRQEEIKFILTGQVYWTYSGDIEALRPEQIQ